MPFLDILSHIKRFFLLVKFITYTYYFSKIVGYVKNILSIQEKVPTKAVPKKIDIKKPSLKSLLGSSISFPPAKPLFLDTYVKNIMVVEYVTK